MIEARVQVRNDIKRPDQSELPILIILLLLLFSVLICA